MNSIPAEERYSRVITYNDEVAHWIYLYVTDANSVAMPKTENGERDMTQKELEDSGCFIINADGVRNLKFFGHFRENLFWLRGYRDKETTDGNNEKSDDVDEGGDDMDNKKSKKKESKSKTKPAEKKRKIGHM